MKSEVSFFAKVFPSKRKCRKCSIKITKSNLVRRIDKVNSTPKSLICKQCTFDKENPIPKEQIIKKKKRRKRIIKSGYVYILYNPAWQGWLKVGKSYDPRIRCYSFQLSSPYRDYKLYHKRFFKDVTMAEYESHTVIDKSSSKRKGEWFKIDKRIARIIIDRVYNIERNKNKNETRTN